MHYYLIAIIILTANIPNIDMISDITGLAHIPQHEGEPATKEDWLETLALEVCGIALTNDSPAVLINAFGPIHYSK